jgi:hypothetical protein
MRVVGLIFVFVMDDFVGSKRVASDGCPDCAVLVIFSITHLENPS